MENRWEQTLSSGKQAESPLCMRISTWFLYPRHVIFSWYTPSCACLYPSIFLELSRADRVSEFLLHWFTFDIDVFYLPDLGKVILLLCTLPRKHWLLSWFGGRQNKMQGTREQWEHRSRTPASLSYCTFNFLCFVAYYLFFIWKEILSMLGCGHQIQEYVLSCLVGKLLSILYQLVSDYIILIGY